MVNNQNALYSPYGAYELKATYQRNLLFSNFLVSGFIVIASITFLIFVKSETPDIDILPEPPTEIRPELPNPPTITRGQPQLDIRPPQTELPVIINLIPIDDQELISEETELVSIDDFAELSDFEDGGPIGNNIGASSFEDDDEMRGLKTFVPDVQIPEFIYKAIPEYPRMEKLAAFEGIVWIAVEVDIDGSVTRAKVYVTSGRDSFDNAALAVAYKNKFRPAIQNGTPVKLWTAYKVEFVLKE